MSQAASVIEELEYVLAAGSSDRRTEILKHVTDLFLGNADNFNSEQIGLIDDVLAHPIRQIETTALAELGESSRPSTTDPMVSSAPWLRPRSIGPADGPRAGGDRWFEKVSLTLRAISERTRLAAAVTDILIQRGDTGVVRKLSQNQGATFSDRGYVTLARLQRRTSDLRRT